MTTITSPGQVVLEGITFNATDAAGVTWVMDSVDGWHDGPSVDVEQVQRIVSHGQFAQAGHRGGRTITQSGAVFAEDRGALASAVDRLAVILADGGFGTYEFIDANIGSRWTSVQLLDTPDIAWDSDGLFCRYQLSLLAPSAYKYGAVSLATTAFAATPVGSGLVFNLFPSGTLDFGTLGNVGQAAVTNYGTASAPVVLTITGPTPTAGFVITDTTTGARIEYLGAVPSGSTLVIDSGAGSVIIDGSADRLGDTIVGAWPSVAAGQTRAFLFEPNGSPTASEMAVSLTSTYW